MAYTQQIKPCLIFPRLNDNSTKSQQTKSFISNSGKPLFHYVIESLSCEFQKVVFQCPWQQNKQLTPMT